ncbi:OLC1v1009094C1 [Oldenlandia corymbosa var. corymbosa]|uniref:OLC1v1009094C1 n=1 Tax=Oldenlandia corymbosa var. corymbosa TaxID=529605 RepID=A0AAV1DPM3_OLDCO|nr:OLC1v1009094C1 [Oldenlandia corymbosa var. corymbosa]
MFMFNRCNNWMYAFYVDYGFLGLQVLAAISSYFLLKLLWVQRRYGLPPGPNGLPILGNLHCLGKNLHQDLCKLSKKYGPIMYLRIGYVPTVVVSSPAAAEKFLKTHDHVFANRPYHQGSWYLCYHQRNLTFSKDNLYWRNMRQICSSNLFSNRRVASFESMRREEVRLMIESLKRAASNGVSVDLSSEIRSLSANMSCLMIFGKKYLDKDFEDRRFGDVIREALHISGHPNFGDYFPLLRIFDIQRLTRRFKEIAKNYDDLIEKIIVDHLDHSQEHQETKEDFVDILMDSMESEEFEFEFDRRHLKAVLLDMLTASMDSTTATIEWTISELLRHPGIMWKLQKEIEQRVGMDRFVEESDLEGLTYLDMVMKESMRLHPASALTLPHVSTEDCIVDGHHIEKNTQLLANIWAIGRDPSVWPDPESFLPERFTGTNVDLLGNDFKLIPFGSGRRSCPGLELAVTVVRFIVAQLVHCFDWELSDNIEPSDLDMSESFGTVTSRAKPLEVIPTYRLHN